MQRPKLAILGGTGALGTGLARCWAQAGYAVIVGSRDATKGAEACAALQAVMRQRGVISSDIVTLDNALAAAAGDIVIVTVPFAYQRALLEQVRVAVQGKIVVDATVSLVAPKVGTVQLPAEGSAGQVAQNVLGVGVRVVSAFQNVAALQLQEGRRTDCDVLVCGNDREARTSVISLVEACGMRGLHAGPIENAAAVEALTSVLITLNRQYKSHSGIRITGLGGHPVIGSASATTSV